jgi:hypothetical protein
MVSLARFQRLQAEKDALAATVQELQNQMRILAAQTLQTGGHSSHPTQQSVSAQAAPNMSMDSNLSPLSNDLE